MGTITSRANLAFYMRGALEQWTKEYLSGPWDDLVDLLAKAIDDGQLSLTEAARLDYLLRATTGADVRAPYGCDVCESPKRVCSYGGAADDEGD